MKILLSVIILSLLVGCTDQGDDPRDTDKPDPTDYVASASETGGLSGDAPRDTDKPDPTDIERRLSRSLDGMFRERPSVINVQTATGPTERAVVRVEHFKWVFKKGIWYAPGTVHALTTTGENGSYGVIWSPADTEAYWAIEDYTKELESR
jgi:hypothetical protein